MYGFFFQKTYNCEEPDGPTSDFDSYARTFCKIFKIFKKHIYAGTEKNVDLHLKRDFYLIKKTYNFIYILGPKTKISKFSLCIYMPEHISVQFHWFRPPLCRFSEFNKGGRNQWAMALTYFDVQKW